MCNFTTIIDNALPNTLYVWHYILSHPSNDVLQYISTYFPYTKYRENFTCHACHLSKQCNPPFSTSSFVTSNFFWLSPYEYLGSHKDSFYRWFSVFSNYYGWFYSLYLEFSLVSYLLITIDGWYIHQTIEPTTF